jgi:transcriptional regulator with XRE-family HTH domain
MPRRTLAAFDLKAARKVRGLSQTKTAAILCATQPSVARWESDGNMPEVFRKVWLLHWQLEDMKRDTETNGRSRELTPRINKTGRSKKGIKRSAKGPSQSVTSDDGSIAGIATKSG